MLTEALVVNVTVATPCASVFEDATPSDPPPVLDQFTVSPDVVLGFPLASASCAVTVTPLPTVGATLPGYDMEAVYCIFAPARTPPDIVARLHHEVENALATADVRERFAPLAVDPIGSPPAQFKTFVATQIKMFEELVRVAKIEPQ